MTLQNQMALLSPMALWARSHPQQSIPIRCWWTNITKRRMTMISVSNGTSKQIACGMFHFHLQKTREWRHFYPEDWSTWRAIDNGRLARTTHPHNWRRLTDDILCFTGHLDSHTRFVSIHLTSILWLFIYSSTVGHFIYSLLLNSQRLLSAFLQSAEKENGVDKTS